jgi:uncharacterized membrane protein YbhN (UPF0104 family)
VLVHWFSVHHLDRDVKQIIGLILLTALLYTAAGIGMAFVAGFSAVQHELASADWWWLAPACAAVLLSFCGYYLAYQGIARAEGGPQLDTPSLLAVVTAGFGGFLAQGATALDEFAMRAGGADEREAKVRVSALAGFEHGVLAMIVCPAAMVALAMGLTIPRTDYTLPWAVIPPLGFGLAIWLAERYRERLRGRKGWRGRVGVFFDSIHVVWANLRNPREHGLAVLGMAVYWAADIFGLWAAMAAFGLHLNPLTGIIMLGTGMLFTRRTGPLGGAGIVEIALIAAMWNGGDTPFAPAVLGVAAYRFFTLWLPLPGALAALPKLRALGRRGEDSSGSGTPVDKGEPALQH